MQNKINKGYSAMRLCPQICSITAPLTLDNMQKKVFRAIIFKNLQVWLVILLPLYSLAVLCVFQQNRLYLENEVGANDDDDDNCDDKDKNDI